MFQLVSFTISAIVEILSCIAIHPILNRVGRKLPYFVAAIGFALVALGTILFQSLFADPNRGIWFRIEKQSSTFCFFFKDQKTIRFVMNVLLKFFASGSYNIIYIYANELFPTRIRNTGMGICSMVARKFIFNVFCF